MASVSVEKSKRSKGTRWIVRWREGSGRGAPQRSITLPPGTTKAQAEAWAAQKRLELVGMPGYQKPPVSVDYAIGKFFESKWSEWAPSTREGYDYARRRLPDWLTKKAVSEVTVADVERALVEIAGKVGLAAVSKSKTVLDGGLSWAVKDQRIASNPVAEADTPKKAAGTTKKKRKKAAAASREEPVDVDAILPLDAVERIVKETNPHWWPLGTTLYRTGIRIGEAAALNVGDVDLDARTMTISESRSYVPKRYTDSGQYGENKEPKSERSERTIGLPDDVVEVLRPLVEGRHPSEPLFVGPKGGRLSPDRYRQREFGPAAKRAGYGGYTPHDLRHHCASVLFRDGVPPGSIAKYLGHTVAVLLDVYAGFFEEDDRRVVEALNRAVGR